MTQLSWNFLAETTLLSSTTKLNGFAPGGKTPDAAELLAKWRPEDKDKTGLSGLIKVHSLGEQEEESYMY
ncbi:hypothetical protein BT96DRAFT_1009736 [Gymnopus androsaceus JB14]|uniref:Uncharacterized protein n=1 Tax=Gymnopus androsaceus JB14 TaxID=1447944 RepID=A0A6A4GBX9_9AGAR|nr:hypothetical protein BT96DRAFT_1009736 [Gymnopus androsaceus JB14]